MTIKKTSFTIATDTSTICVFDLAALRHRLQDDCDWWIDPDELSMEHAAANALFIELGCDGHFEVTVEPELHNPPSISKLLRVPSGRVFVGAGEEVTGDGLEPEGVRGGGFVELSPGTFQVQATRVGLSIIISFKASTDEPKNTSGGACRLAP